MTDDPHFKGPRQRNWYNPALIVTIVILATVPIPFGANAPHLWPIFSSIAGAGVMIVGIRHYVQRSSPRFGLSSARFEATCWLVLCIYVLATVVPIDALAPRVSSATGAVFLVSQISIVPGTTVLQLTQFLGLGAVAYLAAQCSSSRGSGRALALATAVIVAAHGAFGLAALTQWGDTLLGLPKEAYQGSATGTFVNRNSFATFLSLGLVTATSVFVSELMKGNKTGAGAIRGGLLAMPALSLVGIIAVALFASNSRMGVLAGLLGAIAVLALAFFARAKRTGARIGLAVAFAGLVAILFYPNRTLFERLSSVERDLDVRLDLYRQVINLIQARPFTGYGGSSFEYAFPLVHRAPVSYDLVWNKAHSTYLGLWVDYGLIAGTLPTLIVAVVFVRMIAACFKSTTLSTNQLACLGGIVVVAIHSTVDFSLEISAVAYLFATMMGAGLGSLTKRTVRGEHK